MNGRSRRERHFLEEDSALPRHSCARRKYPRRLPDDGECGCQNRGVAGRSVYVGAAPSFAMSAVASGLAFQFGAVLCEVEPYGAFRLPTGCGPQVG
jgi:hypothetical protein